MEFSIELFVLQNRQLERWRTDSDRVGRGAPHARILHASKVIEYIRTHRILSNLSILFRVDRHEVSFRIEANPEKKTAADIAKQINNDGRVKNNLLRRYGVLVTQAGVGDKTKDNTDGVSSERHVEEGPDVTHVMAFMFAGELLRRGFPTVMMEW